MAHVETTSTPLTLEEFLASPLAYAEPAWEFLDGGRLEQKVSPNSYHALIQIDLGRRFLNHVLDHNIEAEVVSEMRATLPRTSPVPDLAVYRGRFARDNRGEIPRFPRLAPVLVIEILSPGQTVKELVEKCRDMVAQGAEMGMVVDPRRREVTLVDDRGSRMFHGADVLPLDAPEFDGLQLTVDQVFARIS